MKILLNFAHLAPEAGEGLGHRAAHALVAQRVRGCSRGTAGFKATAPKRIAIAQHFSYLFWSNVVKTKQ